MAGFKSIAIIGGTGKEGGGLAVRWAHAGYDVIIGSREKEKADRVAGELNDYHEGSPIQGMANPDAVAAGDIAVLTVPYSAHKPTLEGVRDALQGKVMVDVTVPLKPPVAEVHIPEGLSAAQEAQAHLGDGVTVVAAFQNISASHLKELEHDLASDVIVVGDDADAKADAIALAEAAGMNGIDGGALANAVVVEGLTAMLIHINKRYGVKDAGIRITGIGDAG